MENGFEYYKNPDDKEKLQKFVENLPINKFSDNIKPEKLKEVKTTSIDELLDSAVYEANENEHNEILLETEKKMRSEIAILKNYLSAKENFELVSKQADAAISKLIPMSHYEIGLRLAQKIQFKQIIDDFEKDFSNSNEAEVFARARLSTLEETRSADDARN